jgi:hypothetical protein
VYWVEHVAAGKGLRIKSIQGRILIIVFVGMCQTNALKIGIENLRRIKRIKL